MNKPKDDVRFYTYFYLPQINRIRLASIFGMYCHGTDRSFIISFMKNDVYQASRCPQQFINEPLYSMKDINLVVKGK